MKNSNFHVTPYNFRAHPLGNTDMDSRVILIFHKATSF